MILVAFYEDHEREYSTVIWEGNVDVKKSHETFGVESIFSIILSIFSLTIGGLFLFIKIRERVSGIAENKRFKLGPNSSIIDKFRHFISA